MTEQELIEALADKEHASWARWMEYLFSKCSRYEDDEGRNCLLIPTELEKHWQRQIDTHYADLSEREKQSDRDEVAHILPIINEYAHSDPHNATPQEAIDARLHRIENVLRYLGECGGESLLDQATLAQTIARMDKQIRRLNSEVFATGITKHLHKDEDGNTCAVRRRTLLGRVDELSRMAALGDVDQSFFLE